MTQPTPEQLREYKLIRQFGRDWNLSQRAKKKKPFAEELIIELDKEMNR